jgi:ABC-2 type transport system ATP-binding protein
MKQKLGLACALLGTPDLLLDEPGVGVDPISGANCGEWCAKMADQGIAVVWSTSYLDEAEACDEVLLLNQGRLLFAGPPRDLTAGCAAAPAPRRRGGRGGARPCPPAAPAEVADGRHQGANCASCSGSGRAGRTGGPGYPGAAAVEGGRPALRGAFIDLLGGGPGGESALAAAARPRPGSSVESSWPRT